MKFDDDRRHPYHTNAKDVRPALSSSPGLFGNDSVRPGLGKRSKFLDYPVLISNLPVNKILRSLLRRQWREGHEY